MFLNSISEADFDEIGKALVEIVHRISSLEELETWLKLQKYVESVRLQDYLIKTQPPQREFVVEFKMDDGSIKTKAIDILVLGNRKFEFRELHDS